MELETELLAIEGAIGGVAPLANGDTRTLPILDWLLKYHLYQCQAAQTTPDIAYRAGSNGKVDALSTQSLLTDEALNWGHSSSVASNATTATTFQLVRHALWRPSMAKDVRSFVDMPLMSALEPSLPLTRKQGFFNPLPVLSRAWFHICVDFITGLSLADRKNNVIICVNYFYKAVHLLALPSLPTGRETLKLLLQHIVQLHGSLQDVVSDHGQQFIAGSGRYSAGSSELPVSPLGSIL